MDRIDSSLAPAERGALVERRLEPDERALLAKACRQLGIEPGDWAQVPALRDLFETLAAFRLSDALLADRRFKRTRRLCDHLAAAALGLHPSVVESRRKRLPPNWRLTGQAAPHLHCSTRGQVP